VTPSPAALAVAVLLAATGCARQSADLLLLNARVYTLDWGDPARDGTPAADAPHTDTGWHPDAEAVAVAGGRILFVGSTEDAERYRAPHTWVRDLHGATVIPGLVDSHTHVAGLGENLGRVDLVGAQTEDEVIARVRQQPSNVQPGEWIVGYGWDEGAWANRYPTMEALSAAFPNNPVVLHSLHGFATWGNRMAFAEAGIGRQTDAPSGGEIVKDARGNPTGILLNRASGMLDDAMPAPDIQQLIAYFHAGLVAMTEGGYTAIHEAGVDYDGMRALQALEDGDDLPVRVYAMLSARDTSLLHQWLARGPDADTDSFLRTRSVKAFDDGALGSRGARLLEDYSDRPGYRGVSGTEYGFDQALVAEMMRAGFQVAIHAIGDAGNRETLDFIERVVTEDSAVIEGRHRIEHAQVVDPADFPRFATLRLIASMQPPHAVEDMAWAEDRLGPVRIRGAYAWRTMREQGAHLIFNSDLTGSDHSIFYGLHAAITRRNKALQPPGGWFPEQAVRPEEAIRAYTAWPAYAAFVEDKAGVIAPGRWADLTVLDIDPFVLGETDPAQILDGSILLTVVAGEVVYDRQP
jgi:predicted amidohydrolase YtcJ